MGLIMNFCISQINKSPDEYLITESTVVFLTASVFLINSPGAIVHDM